jgi:hypothetical protein
LERLRAANVLAELLEPTIVAMKASAFTLTGVERVAEQAFAQGWLVRFVRDEGAGSIGPSAHTPAGVFDGN